MNRTQLAALRLQLKESAQKESAQKESTDRSLGQRSLMPAGRRARMALAMVNAKFAQPEWAELNVNYAAKPVRPINVQLGVGPLQ